MRGLSLLRFQRALLGLGMLGALLGLEAAPTPEAPPSEGVQVPVVFDGVRYEPEEFNRIWADFDRRGVDLCFVLFKGNLYAFSTLEGCNAFLQKIQPGGPPLTPPSPSDLRPLHMRVEGGGVWVGVEPIPESSPPDDGVEPQQICQQPNPSMRYELGAYPLRGRLAGRFSEYTDCGPSSGHRPLHWGLE